VYGGGVLVPLVIVWAVVNTVAWMYGSTQALPWGTVILLFLVWAVRKYLLYSKAYFDSLTLFVDCQCV